MTASKESVAELLGPVVEWLAEGGDAWEMDLAYWRRRTKLMNEGQMFDGPPSPYLSNIDTAMDSFSPDPDRHDRQINEGQLRAELEAAIVELRKLGYLTET